MKDEIIGGLRNAIERGSSLDEAVQSFINAGYNPVEVRESAKNMTMGASAILSPPQISNSQPKSLKSSPSASSVLIKIIIALLILIVISVGVMVFFPNIISSILK